MSGAAGGFFGSLGATAWGGAGGEWKGIGGKYAGSDVGTIAFGALSGGVGAELSGGNFWQGAIAGGIVSGLNHVMHQMDGEDGIDPPSKKKPDPQSPEEQAKYAQDIRNLNDTFGPIIEGMIDARTFFATLEFKLPELKMPNWFKTTSHGSERLAGNLATRGGFLSLREAWTTRILGSGYPQAGGGTVYLRQLSNGRYNAVVWGERGIITTMKGWSQNSINRVAKNYGWKL